MIKFVLVITAASGAFSGVAINTEREFTDKAVCEAAAAAIEKEADTNTDSRVFGTRAVCVEWK